MLDKRAAHPSSLLPNNASCSHHCLLAAAGTGTGFTFQTPQGLPLPPGSLPAPNTSFLTCLELGGCDLRGAFPSLAMLLSRCGGWLPRATREPSATRTVSVFLASHKHFCFICERKTRGKNNCRFFVSKRNRAVRRKGPTQQAFVVFV